MKDILFKTEDAVFSYRVAGICIQNGKVLLQTCADDPGYAFPGGHAAFGETNEQTLVREFQEKCGFAITVGKLRWVGEIFFPWGGKRAHQICLYYGVRILDPSAPSEGSFAALETMDGQRFPIRFHWVPLDSIRRISLYPRNAVELLECTDTDVRHFVYREE